MAHLSDYITEFINSDSVVTPTRRSYFIQAYSLLNLHLIHSVPAATESNSPNGFQIYSPLHSNSATEDSAPGLTQSSLLSALRKLTASSTSSGTRELEVELDYFSLCRELGADQVDGMFRGKILELRWTNCITDEGSERRERGMAPVIVATTPVVRYAMGVVLKESADVV